MYRYSAGCMACCRRAHAHPHSIHVPHARASVTVRGGDTSRSRESRAGMRLHFAYRTCRFIIGASPLTTTTTTATTTPTCVRESPPRWRVVHGAPTCAAARPESWVKCSVVVWNAPSGSSVQRARHNLLAHAPRSAWGLRRLCASSCDGDFETGAKALGIAHAHLSSPLISTPTPTPSACKHHTRRCTHDALTPQRSPIAAAMTR